VCCCWCAVLLQVLALDVIPANGTRKVFTKETDPFLMKVRSRPTNSTSGSATVAGCCTATTSQ
jgi:hypothetical protein